MKKLFLMAIAAMMTINVSAQNLSVKQARFHQGDDKSWAKPETNDADWKTIDMTMNWDDQGYAINNGYAWYRVHLTIPSTILKGAEQQKFVVFDLPKADDADECYLNGRLIGKTGGMPDSPGGYKSNWNAVRSYTVDVKSGGILWDKDNVIAIRVYNAGEPGGLFERPLSVRVPSTMDGLSMHFTDVNDGKAHCDVQLRNTYPQVQSGKLDVVVTDRESGAVLSKLSKKASAAEVHPHTSRTRHTALQRRSAVRRASGLTRHLPLPRIGRASYEVHMC